MNNRKTRHKVPSLIPQCSDDLIAPQSVGEYLHASLPQSTFQQMKATGHCPHLSAPGAVIDAMNDFLKVRA